jgi:hypothetical protein
MKPNYLISVYHLYLLVFSLANFSILKMEAICSSETPDSLLCFNAVRVVEYVARMEEKRKAFRILAGKAEGQTT